MEGGSLVGILADLVICSDLGPYCICGILRGGETWRLGLSVRRRRQTVLRLGPVGLVALALGNSQNLVARRTGV